MIKNEDDNADIQSIVRLQAENLKIGEILQRCDEVPLEIQKILEPLTNIRLRRLVNALKRIEVISCAFLHEKTQLRPPACETRDFNAGCGHQGINNIIENWKDAGRDREHFSVDPQAWDNNNAVAILQYATALVVALGGNNAERAADVMEQLKTYVYTIAQSDDAALGLYVDEKDKKIGQEEYKVRKAILEQNQQTQAKALLGIRDNVLSLIHTAAQDLMQSSERKKSGTFKTSMVCMGHTNVHGAAWMGI